jgi:hypothetical protein
VTRKTLLAITLILSVGCYPEQWVDVSPDGKALVISCLEEYEGVFWLSLDGNKVRRLADQGWCAKFSPDGTRCVFMSWEGDFNNEADKVDLVLYDLATDRQKVLRSWPKTEDEAPFILPSWRPDGKEIAYVVWRLVEEPEGQAGIAHQTELHIIDPQTLEDREIEDNVGIHCAWSPDGNHLAFYQSEIKASTLPDGFALGSLNQWSRKERRMSAAAGLLLDPFAHLAWLSNDRVLFVAPSVSLPCSEREKDDMDEAVFVYDLMTKTVAPIHQTKGISWRAYSSCLRLSPDCRRLLFGTHVSGASGAMGLSGSVKPWCYDFASSGKTMVAEAEMDAYPFWVTSSQVGYFEGDDKIVIVDIDEKPEPVVKQTLDLEKLLGPLQPQKQGASATSTKAERDPRP